MSLGGGPCESLESLTAESTASTAHGRAAGQGPQHACTQHRQGANGGSGRAFTCHNVAESDVNLVVVVVVVVVMLFEMVMVLLPLLLLLLLL